MGSRYPRLDETCKECDREHRAGMTMPYRRCAIINRNATISLSVIDDSDSCYFENDIRYVLIK